jgi:hypothetical protein
MAARFQAKSKKNIGEGSASGGIGGALLLTSCARSEEPKTRNIGSFKSKKQPMHAAPCFFARVSACHEQTTFPLDFFRAVKLVVLRSDCKRESGSESG